MNTSIVLKYEDSDCGKNQKIIVSKDPGESRVHRAINTKGMFDVRHYKLDGNIVKNRLCCDFLLINDTTKKAYYIELKGKDIDKAVKQILAGEDICRKSLVDYVPYFRIVASSSPTHSLFPTSYRNLLDKVGTERLKCKTTQMEEELT